MIDELGYKRKLVEVDEAILANAAFLNQIVANPEIFENYPAEDEEAFGESLDGPRDESEGLPDEQVVCPTNGERSPHAQETGMGLGAAPRRRHIILAIRTHPGTRMNTHTHIPMDPTSILLQIKKNPGADADRRIWTWTKCEARSNSSCATGARK